MFFFLSRVANFLITPQNWIVLALIGMIAYEFYRKRRPIKLLIVFAVIFFATSPIGPLGLRLFENNFRPRSDVKPLRAAVVLAGGGIRYSKTEEAFIWGGWSARPIEAIRLAKLGLVQKLIFSGASPSTPNLSILNEGESAAKLALHLRVQGPHIHVISKGRNTFEEAESIIKELKRMGIGKFYLITHAFHMGRSLGVYRKLGAEPVPFPVSHMTTGGWRDWRFSFDNMGKLYLFLHEVLGRIAYSLTGKI